MDFRKPYDMNASLSWTPVWQFSSPSKAEIEADQIYPQLKHYNFRVPLII